jgi:hypothetical protein
MSKNPTQKKKWSSDQVKARRALASKLRTYRKSSSALDVWIGELAIVRQSVKEEHLRDEPDLAKTRWVTYSYMSALKCTELFGELYLDAYRTWYERLKDYSTAADQRPVSAELFLNDARQINGLWRARQEADRIGMPYEMFLNATIGWGAEQKNRNHFPAPNQLYGEAQLKVAQERWQSQRDIIGLFGDDWDDRLFVGDEKAGLPRLKAMRLAYARVTTSKNPDIALANLMGRCGAIDETLARRMFQSRPGLVDKAMTQMAPLRKVRDANGLRPYVPHCLGITFDSVAQACSSCPLLTKCELLWRQTTEELERTTGSANPRATRKTQLARERQRRCRQRHRDAAMTCADEAA